MVLEVFVDNGRHKYRLSPAIYAFLWKNEERLDRMTANRGQGKSLSGVRGLVTSSQSFSTHPQ